MPNYANGKIYTIRFYNSNEIYIGSTTNTLSRRFYGHKFPPDTSLSKHISSNYNNDWSLCYIELYENYNCDNIEQLARREGEVIRHFMTDACYTCINNNIAGRTTKEWRSDNIDHIKEKKKEFRKLNPDKIKEDHFKWRENNRDKINEASRLSYSNNKDYYVKYREDNKTQIKEKRQQYYQEHKLEMLEKLKETKSCACGSIFRKYETKRHERTKKHLDYINSLVVEK